MRKGWESWGCSAWRREGCGGTLLRPFNIYRVLIRKMRANFLAGPVAIEQGIMVLNQGRVDLD